MPYRRHRSFTVTSRRKPSRTMRIFSSGVYLRRVSVLTRITKDLVSSVRSSAASALSESDWDTSAPFCGYLYPQSRSSHHLYILGCSDPPMRPIIADRLHMYIGITCTLLGAYNDFTAAHDGDHLDSWRTLSNYQA